MKTLKSQCQARKWKKTKTPRPTWIPVCFNLRFIYELKFLHLRNESKLRLNVLFFLITLEKQAPVVEIEQKMDDQPMNVSESENDDFDSDFMVIDEVACSQETSSQVLTGESVPIDVDVKESGEEDPVEKTEEAGKDDVETAPIVEETEPNVTTDDEPDTKTSLPVITTDELLRIPTPPPLLTEPIEDDSSLSNDLASQIQAALKKAKEQVDSGSNTENQKPSEDVVELLDDEEDENIPESTDVKKAPDEIKPVMDHECINPKCERSANDFVRARKFIVNHFRQNGEKLSKKQFVCSPCYDLAVEKYRGYSERLLAQKPLLQMEMPMREEVVELLSDGEESDNEDSSEEERVPKETLDLLNNELETIIAETLQKVNISKQMGWTMQIIKARTENNQKMLDENHADLLALEQKANAMYRKLYAVNEVQYHNLPTLEINSTNDGRLYKEKYHLPVSGPVIRPQINLSSIYFAVKQRLLSSELIVIFLRRSLNQCFDVFSVVSMQSD